LLVAKVPGGRSWWWLKFLVAGVDGGKTEFLVSRVADGRTCWLREFLVA
jgi:hypothetical protein